MGSRRDFIKKSGMAGIAGLMAPTTTFMETKNTPVIKKESSKWADGSRLIVSVSMQFEAGGQPENAESPFPQNMEKGFIDFPASTWYQYGYKVFRECSTTGTDSGSKLPHIW